MKIKITLDPAIDKIDSRRVGDAKRDKMNKYKASILATTANHNGR